MDAVDFAIYRWMFPDGRGQYWGIRSNVDPRISAEQIAGQVGLSPSAVRTRIRGLRASGFIQGYEVWPNPSLFGCGLMTTHLPAPDTTAVDRIFGELGLVDGVISARDMHFEENRRVQVIYISDTPESTARRGRLIARLAEGPPIVPPAPRWFPECSTAPSALDWRIIGTLRANPERSLPELAATVGVSLKTLTLHFHRLLDSKAVLWVMKADNSQLSVCVYFLYLDGSRLRGEVESAVEERRPEWLPLAPGGGGEVPAEKPEWIVGVFWLTAPSAAADLDRDLLAIPGVARIRRFFPGKAINYNDWMDAQLNRQLHQLEGHRPRTSRPPRR